MENFNILDLLDQDYLDEIQRNGSTTTNGDCLMESLNDINLRHRIHNLINRNVTQVYFGPCLSFDFISENEVELDQVDLKDVCELFGKVLLIDQKEQQSALVLFENSVDCFFAQRILNCHFIRELNLQLMVRWGSQREVQELLTKLKLNEFDGNFQEEKPFPIQQVPKFTCRYEIQIDNDHDFQAARKIIGSKGCNMKKILDQCCDKQSQVVKLRLRGKGSGYKEGPTKQESNEQLHLCVSSKFSNQFQKACNLVEQLLQKIFEEYKHQYSAIGRKSKTVFYKKLSNTNKAITPTVGQQYYEFPVLMQIPKVDKLRMR